MWLVAIVGLKRPSLNSLLCRMVNSAHLSALKRPQELYDAAYFTQTASRNSEAMAFHGQHPFQYMPPPQPQHVNAAQPPFGPGSFSVNGPTGPASFNDLSLPNDQGTFTGHDFAPASTQSHDQPQNAGSFRAFSSQLVQLELRLEGRFHEVRLRAESADL
jgi:hypothetical protein